MYKTTFREKPKRTNEPTQPREGENKMTKFEEELRKIKPRKKFLEFNAGITYWYCLSDLIQKFGNWHSDEEFQDMKSIGGSFALANQNLIDENKKLVKEITNLKSQLQQQALPVVPELTQKQADTLNTYKKSSASLAIYLLTEIKKRDYDYFARAWLDGYTVGKPQLFYLRNKLTGMYLYKKHLGGYGEDPASYIKDLTNDFKFTQKEIDGMDVQSYEKKDEYKGE